MSVNIMEFDEIYNNIKEKDIDIENFIINDFSDLNDLENNDDLFKTKITKNNNNNNKKNLHLFTVTKLHEKKSPKKNKNNNIIINNSDTNSILSTNVNFKENESILSSKYFLNLSERMKIKKEKAKILLDKKTNREHNSISLIENNKKISKKELKMLRNRLSAQKSRDRKKKEFDKLKQLTEDLINENKMLKNTIKNNENKFYNTFQYLCNDCKEIMKKHNNQENLLNINDNSIYNKNNFSFKNKCTLITGLLTIICLLGTFFSNYENNNVNNKRILQQHFIELNKYNLNNNNQFNYKKEFNNDNNNNNNKILPFKIEKDFSIRNKNNINNNNNKYLTHNSMVPINYPLEEYYENNNHLDKQNNIHFPTLFCTDFYLGKNSSDEFFNTIYNNNNQIKNSISQFNLNIDQQPKLSFNGTDAIIKLIVPSDYNNLIQKNIRKNNKEYFKLSCKIIDIIKEYR